MPGQWTTWSTPPFRVTQKDQYRQSPNSRKNALVRIPDDCRVTRTGPVTNILAVIENFRKEPRTFGRRARQRHTKNSRVHETRRNTGGTQRCGKERRHFASGGTRTPPPAFFPLAIVSFATSRTTHSWSMDFAPRDSTVAVCTTSIPPEIPTLAQAQPSRSSPRSYQSHHSRTQAWCLGRQHRRHHPCRPPAVSWLCLQMSTSQRKRRSALEYKSASSRASSSSSLPSWSR